MMVKVTKSMVALALAGAALAASGAPGVRAQVDRTTVPAGESFTLSITFEGVAAAGAPSLPAIAGVNFAGVSQRSEFVLDNNQSSSKQIFEYRLVPTQAGDLTIPAIAVQASGQIFTTQPIGVKVLPPGAGANPQAAATNLA